MYMTLLMYINHAQEGHHQDEHSAWWIESQYLDSHKKFPKAQGNFHDTLNEWLRSQVVLFREGIKKHNLPRMAQSQLLYGGKRKTSAWIIFQPTSSWSAIEQQKLTFKTKWSSPIAPKIWPVNFSLQSIP